MRHLFCFVFKSGDIQVHFLFSLVQTNVAILRLLAFANCTYSSPISFLLPNPYFPTFLLPLPLLQLSSSSPPDYVIIWPLLFNCWYDNYKLFKILFIYFWTYADESTYFPVTTHLRSSYNLSCEKYLYMTVNKNPVVIYSGSFIKIYQEFSSYLNDDYVPQIYIILTYEVGVTTMTHNRDDTPPCYFNTISDTWWKVSELIDFNLKNRNSDLPACFSALICNFSQFVKIPLSKTMKTRV